MTATKTQLTGGLFQDSQGNVLVKGYLKFKLNQDNSVTGAANIAAGIEITITLNSSGGVDTGTPQYVWATDVMTVPNAFYRVTGYNAQGQPAWGPNNQQVISGGVGGGTFDVGTWVPNSVFSWTPPNQPISLQTNGTPNTVQNIENLKAGANITLTSDGTGGTTIAAAAPAGIQLQTNGTNNGSQAKLNLENGSGITISDDGIGGITISNASPGPTLSVAGQGWMIGPGYFDSALLSSGVSQNSLPVTNSVHVQQFQVPYAVTFRRWSWKITGSAIPATLGFAIYSADGLTKLIDTGGIVKATDSPTYVMGTFSPVTLPPGSYWFAWAATGTAQGLSQSVDTTSSGNDNFYGWGSTPTGVTASITNMAAAAGTVTVIAANTFTAGQAVLLSVLSNGSFNAQYGYLKVVVTAASPTQFTFVQGASTIASAACTGTASQVYTRFGIAANAATGNSALPSTLGNITAFIGSGWITPFPIFAS